MGKDLDHAILEAHAAGDGWRLVDLYTQGADGMADADAALFLLTTAYIYALEADHPAAPTLETKLRTAGRL